MWALHAALIAAKIVPLVPAPVLAQAWRGGRRQANLARLLAPCRTEVMTADQARAVGVLVGRSHHDDIVDVTVVETAGRHRDPVVVTADRADIERVARAAGIRLRIEDV